MIPIEFSKEVEEFLDKSPQCKVVIGYAETKAYQDFQNAPYEDLCGCVGAIVPTYLNNNVKATKPVITRSQSVVTHAQNRRIALVNCPKCKGTGLKET
jgi:hypothetical protein